MVAGIAVNALGHAHPAVQAAVTKQAAEYGHTSNLAIHPVGVELAERLIELAGRPGRVFFCNSGAEANEAAFKVARLSGKSVVHAAQGSFHGRTMGALSLTGQPPKRAPFEPLVPQVQFHEYGEVPALTGESAAVIVEPIQGEAGVIPAPVGYLADLAALPTLLIADEVQTGIGRTGHWFAVHSDGVEPDMITLAKGLGGGLPIGALLTFGPAADLLAPGHHGSTFGGNPIACAAALAVLDTIAADGLLENATDVGNRIATAMSGIDGVDHVRGRGLLLAAVLTEPVAKQAESAARERGVLFNAIGDNVIRMAPPLNLMHEQADRACEVLGEVLS
jgi:acetylornithine aminotransferase